MAECNKCGASIVFNKNKNDKWVPANPDGSDHWDDCKSKARKKDASNSTPKLMAVTKATILTLPKDGVGLPWD
jgi:hypothetical protein